MKQLILHLPRFLLCLATLIAVELANLNGIAINATTAALLFLVVVLASATYWGLTESLFASLASVLLLNYFFFPPLRNLTISDPENWVALFAFVFTAVTASRLSSKAKRRADEALAGRNELAKLYEFSRALLMDEGPEAVRSSIAQAGQILGIGQIAFWDVAAGRVYGSAASLGVSHRDLMHVARSGRSVEQGGASIIPVRLGSHIVGSLATPTRQLSLEARESVASLIAINSERAQALERAAIAEIARRSEEFKSSLLDGLAHDLKTPLTAVRSCITRLISIPPHTEEVRQELLSIIDQESLRLQATITEAIDLARIESNALHLERRITDLAEIVEDSISDARATGDPLLIPDIVAGLTVYADGNLLRRALGQVIENARKYSPPGSHVRIEAQQTTDTLLITVLDRGPGFQEDELERIFNKYYRGRSTDETDGTGMGLAIARSIVEAHGGEISAINRPEGGAAVLMKIPNRVDRNRRTEPA